jgi:hypothetical protein
MMVVTSCILCCLGNKPSYNRKTGPKAYTYTHTNTLALWLVLVVWGVGGGDKWATHGLEVRVHFGPVVAVVVVLLGCDVYGVAVGPDGG